MRSSKCGVNSLNFSSTQNRKMNQRTYDDLVKHLKTGAFPKRFSSSKSNFKKLVGKHTVNKKGTLFREGKMVVKRSERKKIYERKSCFFENSLENITSIRAVIKLGKRSKPNSTGTGAKITSRKWSHAASHAAIKTLGAGQHKCQAASQFPSLPK